MSTVTMTDPGGTTTLTAPSTTPSKNPPCETCRGRGHEPFAVTYTCDVCEGEGRIGRTRCVDCHGHGTVQAHIPCPACTPEGAESCRCGEAFD